MSAYHADSREQPFPERLPPITITPSDAPPFAVDCREVPGWFGIPEVGDHTLWTLYDPPDWHLSYVTEMLSARPARIHGVECVEIEVSEWERETGWRIGTWTSFGRLTEDAGEWVANLRIINGTRVLQTFLDEGFSTDWGGRPRHIEDHGRYVRQADGSYTLNLTGPAGEVGALGAGMFEVRIGERSFTCLRVIEIGDDFELRGKAPSDTEILVEAYLDRDGRTLLFRRHNGRRWALHRGSAYADQPWDERFPDHARIVIDGVVYVHWYDCLSDTACGLR